MKLLSENIIKKLSTRYPHNYPHYVAKMLCLCYNFFRKKERAKDCERGDDMWYSAKDVAKYIITKCSIMGKPVSNLKLQKMLYFVWADFYRESRRYLFMDSICAWQLGPVVPEVYYEYCSYAGKPIIGSYGTGIEEGDSQVIDSIIHRYVDVPANILVDRTHAHGTAWYVLYINGAGNRKIIPFDLIIKKEVG